MDYVTFSLHTRFGCIAGYAFTRFSFGCYYAVVYPRALRSHPPFHYIYGYARYVTVRLLPAHHAFCAFTHHVTYTLPPRTVLRLRLVLLPLRYAVGCCSLRSGLRLPFVHLHADYAVAGCVCVLPWLCRFDSYTFVWFARSRTRTARTRYGCTFTPTQRYRGYVTLRSRLYARG